MAVIGVDITDNTLRNRIVTAICGNHGYQAKIPAPNPSDPPIDNPQSRPQFVTEWLKRFFKDQVRGWEASQAAETARKAAADKADAEVVIP